MMSGTYSIYLEVEGVKSLVGATVSYLEASTKEIEVRTALMGIEYQGIVAEQEQKKQEDQDQGMMRAPYGYCPECGAKGVQRRRARDKSIDTDTCEKGHRYPANMAVLRKEVKRPYVQETFADNKSEESHVDDNQS